MKARSQRGFTLIELVVAVAIFAAIAAIAYGSVGALLRARDRLEFAGAQLRAIQMAVTMIERDVRSVVARPVREPYGDYRASLVGERGGLTLTRLRSGGLADETAQAQRVGYALVAGRLTRLAWPVADAAPSTQPRATALLESVEAVSLRYLDEQGQWREVWPAASVAADASLESLPRAVDVRVKVSGFGELRRLLELPDPLPGTPSSGAAQP